MTIHIYLKKNQFFIIDYYYILTISQVLRREIPSKKKKKGEKHNNRLINLHLDPPSLYNTLEGYNFEALHLHGCFQLVWFCLLSTSYAQISFTLSHHFPSFIDLVSPIFLSFYPSQIINHIISRTKIKDLSYSDTKLTYLFTFNVHVSHWYLISKIL